MRAAKVLGSYRIAAYPVVAALLLGLVVGPSSQTRGQPGSVPVHTVDAATPLRDREPVIISADMSMGLNTGNRNGIATSIPDIDDSYAFALAAAHDLDIRGVVVTMGNAMVRPSMATARATVHAVDSDVPVVQGAETWLPVAPLATADGTTFSDACVNDGVRFMAKELRRSLPLAPIPIPELQALTTSPDPVAQFFGKSSQRYLTWWAANLGPAKPIFDAAVVWHLIRPEDHVCERVGFRLKPGSPALAVPGPSDLPDTFSPAFTETRQVSACTGFRSRQAMADYQRAVLSAVGGDGASRDEFRSAGRSTSS